MRLQRQARWAFVRGFFVLALVLVPVRAVQATIHIVDQGGSGDFLTPVAAMASPAVVFGDTVLVMPGTYVGNIVLKGGVKLLGSGPAVTTLDGGAAGPVIILPVNGSFNNVVSGFTIRNGLAERGAGIAAVDPGGPVKALGRQTITRNVIEDNVAVKDTGGFQGLGGGIAIFKQNVTITNNVIRNNTAAGGGGALSIDYSSPMVTGNTISGNIVTDVGGAGGGIYIYAVLDTVRLTNNVVQGNSSETAGGIYAFDAGSSTITVSSSSFAANTGGDCAGVTCTGLGNVAADALFQLPPSDLHLMPASPVIDIADDAAAGLCSGGVRADLPCAGLSDCMGNPSAMPPIPNGTCVARRADNLDADGVLRVLDGDGVGGDQTDMGALEYCTIDPDGDTVDNCTDNCPANANTTQVDAESAAGADGNLGGYLDALRECVGQLKDRARRVVDLHYRDGASREAIAAELDMKPAGVKTLLRRTRELLRECVDRKVNGAASR